MAVVLKRCASASIIMFHKRTLMHYSTTTSFSRNRQQSRQCKGLETDIIYLDFSKAFYSVCHQKRLSKLLYFGIDGPLLKWFESYLSARKQRVVINGSYSSWSEVKSGVIQGSILGPVLFLMFVNDMPEVLCSSNLAMFADDSKY